MKYLIVGLGNIGKEYENTRHNIGFDILNTLAKSNESEFIEKKFAYIADFKYKSRILKLVKPTTFVNLSGKAVNYWLQKEKIPVSNMLILVDDISLPFGLLRLKPSGGDAGHNGLINITGTLGHNEFARLRFGTGNNFSQGQQVNYVLGNWTAEEKSLLSGRISKAVEIIQSFVTVGISTTMNRFNNK